MELCFLGTDNEAFWLQLRKSSIENSDIYFYLLYGYGCGSAIDGDWDQQKYKDFSDLNCKECLGWHSTWSVVQLSQNYIAISVVYWLGPKSKENKFKSILNNGNSMNIFGPVSIFQIKLSSRGLLWENNGRGGVAM